MAVYADSFEALARNPEVVTVVERSTQLWAEIFELEVAPDKSWCWAVKGRQELALAVDSLPVKLWHRDLGADM